MILYPTRLLILSILAMSKCTISGLLAHRVPRGDHFSDWKKGVRSCAGTWAVGVAGKADYACQSSRKVGQTPGIPRHPLDFFASFCLYWKLKGVARMSHEPQRTRPALFSQIDVAQGAYAPAAAGGQEAEPTRLLREILSAQDRQNELLEELLGQLSSAQKQRNIELGQWKQANPRLARNCRLAAEALGKV
jgi:hypothetical protein